MPKPIALQLYTLRQAVEKEGYLKVLKDVAAIGYGHVELAGLYGKSPREIRKTLDGLGLKAIGAHASVLDPAQRSKIADDANELGYNNIGVSLKKEEFENEDLVRKAAERVNDAVNFFGPKGFNVILHNHWWEWSGPRKGDLIAELAPRAQFEIDIYWVKTGGACPVEIIRRYARRTKLLHVKDGPADGSDPKKPMTAVGKGVVDIAGSIRAGEGAGAEAMIVELDHCATDMLQAVRDSYQYLVGHSLATGAR